MSIKLTKQDGKILSLLQSDASLTSTEVAERINMSQSPCWRRINRLEEKGAIKRKVSILDREVLGMELVTFTTINLSKFGRQNMEEVEREIALFDEVLECYTMTGEWDYMLKIVVKDIRHYEQFVRKKLANLPMIGELHSHIAVTEIKNTTELPLRSQNIFTD
ncbi:MAG: Lrp/AsnC family transcriptional regulator [Arenicella sp.]